MTVEKETKLPAITCGDCLQVMASMPAECVDAIVTDPPYGLEFMGKEWDRLGDIGKISHGGISDEKGFKGFKLPNYNGSANKKCESCGKWAWDHPDRKCECKRPKFPNVKGHQSRIMQEWHYQWAVAALRVAKPGTHLLAFGGTRTHHRLMVAIEDAGWEIRDCLMWVYGSGFPKSLDVSKAIDKAAGKLATQSQGANYAGGEYAPRDKAFRSDYGYQYAPSDEAAQQWQGWGTALKPAWEPIILARKPLTGTVAANVLEHGTGALNVDGCRVAADLSEFYSKSGNLRSGMGHAEGYGMGDGFGGDSANPPSPSGRWPANLIHDGSDEVLGLMPGAKSRGEYTHSLSKPKTSSDGVVFKSFGPHDRSNRYAGQTGSAARFFYCAKASKKDRGEGNCHPCVKPNALMRYLCKLITPPGGVILDPFMGSGSTGVAALDEGFDFAGIDLDQGHCDIAAGRMKTEGLF